LSFGNYGKTSMASLAAKRSPTQSASALIPNLNEASKAGSDMTDRAVPADKVRIVGSTITPFTRVPIGFLQSLRRRPVLGESVVESSIKHGTAVSNRLIGLQRSVTNVNRDTLSPRSASQCG